jgi:hypothetical protein
MDYAHTVPLSFIPVDAQWFQEHELQFIQRFEVYLPTSRFSRNNSMILAPRLRSIVNLNPIWGLNVGGNAFVEYDFYRYSTQAGQTGGSNPQFLTYLNFNAEYVFDDLLVLPGSLAFGFDLSTAYTKKYEYIPQDSASAGSASNSVRKHVENAGSGDSGVNGLWRQDWGWDVYVSYTPISYLTASISVEQGSAVLRNGRRRFVPLHRDETDFVLSVLGRY